MLPHGLILEGNLCDTSALGFIEIGYEQLCHFRDDGRVPSPELLADIEAYESILKSADPAGAAETYFEAKRADRSLRPRQVAQSLGWIGGAR